MGLWMGMGHRGEGGHSGERECVREFVGRCWVSRSGRAGWVGQDRYL